MKKILLIILLTAFTRSYCQPNFYERTYGPGTGMCIDKALNGNFIVGATLGAYSSGPAYYFLIDTHGDTLRTMNYPNSGLAFIRQTTDGGFIFTGDSGLGAGVRKTDDVGNILWSHPYHLIEWDTYSNSVILNKENGYFVGYVYDGPSWENPYIVLKTDSAGNTLDSTNVNNNMGDWGQNKLSLTLDSGLISAHSDYDGIVIFLTKLDKNDSIVWTKQFNDPNGINYAGIGSKCAIQTNDGGYLAAGYRTLPQFGPPEFGFIIKTDANGDSLWSKTYYFPNAYVNFVSVQQDSYGQYYITGKVKDSINQNQYSIIILKTTSTGDTLWTRLFKGFGVASPYSMILDSAQNPMVLGYTQDTTTNQSYIYLIKTDTSGNIPLGNIELTKKESELIVYPNPATSTITIHSLIPNSNPQSLTITDVLGNEVYHQVLNNSTQSTINISQLSNGVYFYQLTNNKEIYRGKFVKE